MTSAEIAYFDATRRECDNEKNQKDRILYYAFAVSGAVGFFGLFALEKTRTFPQTVSIAMFCVALLLLIAALLAYRRSKLQYQIYRWRSLYELVEICKEPSSDWTPVESVVMRGVHERRYGVHDVYIFVGATLPVATLLGWEIVVLIDTSQIGWGMFFTGLGGAILYFACRILSGPLLWWSTPLTEQLSRGIKEPKPASVAEPKPRNPVLRVVSLLPNPAGLDTHDETVDIENGSDSPVSLVGWRLRDSAGSEWRLDQDGSIPARATVSIKRNTRPMALSNSGDSVDLIDPTGNLAQRVTYGPAAEGVTITVAAIAAKSRRSMGG
jgi:hypothetical protein